MLCHNSNNKNKTKKPPPKKKIKINSNKINKQQQLEKLAFYSHDLIFLQCLLCGITGIKQLALILTQKENKNWPCCCFWLFSEGQSITPQLSTPNIRKPGLFDSLHL